MIGSGQWERRDHLGTAAFFDFTGAKYPRIRAGMEFDLSVWQAHPCSYGFKDWLHS